MPKSSDKELLDVVKSLKEEVEELKEGSDLEKTFIADDTKKRSQMLDVDPERTDSFGDSVELITKSRLENNSEAFQIAKNFVKREYHNMIGNRYGRHSKLIPVFDENGNENLIDMVWFSGNDVRIVYQTEKRIVKDETGSCVEQETSRPYYKIRLLVRDILTKKILLARIPTNKGAARTEEIQHIGAGRMGHDWIKENAPMNPMKPINYSPGKDKNTSNQSGEVFE